jgi:hypothetical protein
VDEGEGVAQKKKSNDDEVLRRFGRHVARIIERRGFASPYDFWVQRAGDKMSRASLNYILAGKREPKLKTILLLARLLKVSPRDLIDFEGA